MSEGPIKTDFELDAPVSPLSPGQEKNLEDDLIRDIVNLILADFNRDQGGSGNSIPPDGYKLSISRFSIRKKGC